jgi:hypothetical protein
VLPRWDYGDAVRVTRNVRNDGTFPGVPTGDLLVRRGRIGHVRDVGTFLQDQIIYSVHFLDEGRLVGCREEELVGVDEALDRKPFRGSPAGARTRALAVAGRSACRPAVAAKSSISRNRRPRVSSIRRTSTASQASPCGYPRPRSANGGGQTMPEPGSIYRSLKLAAQLFGKPLESLAPGRTATG